MVLDSQSRRFVSVGSPIMAWKGPSSHLGWRIISTEAEAYAGVVRRILLVPYQSTGVDIVSHVTIAQLGARYKPANNAS